MVRVFPSSTLNVSLSPIGQSFTWITLIFTVAKLPHIPSESLYINWSSGIPPTPSWIYVKEPSMRTSTSPWDGCPSNVVERL